MQSKNVRLFSEPIQNQRLTNNFGNLEVQLETERRQKTTAMNRLRWVGEGDIWELDMSTPVTLEATARAVSNDPLPLGLSRGTRLSRPKQAEFFHRFMATPLIPSFSPLHGGLSLQKVLTFPFPNNWYSTLHHQT